MRSNLNPSIQGSPPPPPRNLNTIARLPLPPESTLCLELRDYRPELDDPFLTCTFQFEQIVGLEECHEEAVSGDVFVRGEIQSAVDDFFGPGGVRGVRVDVPRVGDWLSVVGA